MNQSILTGRLTKDPQTGSNSRSNWTTIFLAVEQDVAKDDNGKRPVDFFRITFFAKTAETAAQYTAKDRKSVV